MSIKRCRYTYTPSTPGVIVVRRESDGYACDPADSTGATFAAAPSPIVHTATESAVDPGIFTLTFTADWGTDVYRFYWYPDVTLAGSPKVWSINLVDDMEPAAETNLTADALNDITEAVGTGIDAQDIRDAIGMAAADLDTQLDGIAAHAATLAQIKAKTDLITTVASLSGWVNPDPASTPASTTVVSSLLDEVREVLHDREATLYDNTLMIPLYNRALSEINALLVTLQADVAMSLANIVGDGTNYAFVIGDGNFLAPVPQQFKPRSPETATSNYSWGKALTHCDRMASQLMAVPTTVAAPSKFYLRVSGTEQAIIFDTIPPSGYIYDYLYFTKPTRITSSTVGTATTPWLGFLDNLISRSLEEFAREGKEFTSDKRALWRARAEADISSLLGLRHLQTQERIPSLFRTMPRTSEVW